MADLLAFSADAIVRCSDGVDIPISLFCALSSCSVLKDLAEGEMEMETEKGKRVLPLFMESPPILALMRVVHGGAGTLGALTAGRCGAVLEGARALGAALVERAVVDRMLYLAQRAAPDPEALELNMHHLLEDAATRLQAVELLPQAFPTFEAMRQALSRVAERAHGFTHCMVRDMLPALCKRFVPHCIFVELLRLVPASTLDAMKVMETLAGSRQVSLGAFFHPSEMALLLKSISALFAANGWDERLTRALMTVASSMLCYDAVPLSVMYTHGTVISYQTFPATSVLVILEEFGPSRAVVSRRMTKFLKLSLDRIRGTFCCEVHWNGIDGTLSALACRLDLRISLFKSSQELAPAAEMWKSWNRTVRNVLWVQASAEGAAPEFTACLRDRELSAVRVDLFYPTPSR